MSKAITYPTVLSLGAGSAHDSPKGEVDSTNRNPAHGCERYMPILQIAQANGYFQTPVACFLLQVSRCVLKPSVTRVIPVFGHWFCLLRDSLFASQKHA